MVKKFISWLYEKYVLLPIAQEHGAKSVTQETYLTFEPEQETYITFEPDPEFNAQIEKNTTGPKVH